jgi:tRNA pseudouridine55 synthase
MNKILNVYKPVGMTPLALIEAVRKEMPELRDEKIGYAGRLDPLAHGVMLLMIGEATKAREAYLGLKKTYEFKVLFGVETDSYDILGFIETNKRLDFSFRGNNNEGIVNEKVNLFVNRHVGKFQQPYPPYSSKPVNGKPLFWWARNDRLNDIEIPQREVVIDEFILLSNDEISKTDLQKKVAAEISKVDGDFRQKETLERWHTFFVETNITSFPTATFRVHCTSGTYIRSLIHEMGKELGCGAIALEILRTQVGDFYLNESLKFDLHQSISERSSV